MRLALVRASVVLGITGVVLCSPSMLTAQKVGKKSASAHRKPTYLLQQMRTLRYQLKPQYMGVHPRVYFTDAELKVLRTRAHGVDKVWWQRQLASLRVLKGPPPAPPAQARRNQNTVGLAIAEAAFAYRIQGTPRILALTKEYMNAACSYPVWGYTYDKPNVDLAAGHLLYGVAVGYDLLYHDLTPPERARYRACIAFHGHLVYEFFRPRPGHKWTFSQNHTFIPIAGLGVAAYAVYGEVPEAAQWAALARAIYKRVLETYSQDGYYYEGVEYWIFATPWLIHYLDALKHAAGVDLFNQSGLRKADLYMAYSMTPGGQLPFDFGDVYEGAITRAHQGSPYRRSHPNGHFRTNYNLLYDLAAQFHSPQIQGVADWLRSLGQTSQEPWWTLAWRDPNLPSEPMTRLKPWHWFHDHDVVFWRSGWGPSATAIAFRCGPPEGHSATGLIPRLPAWRRSEGHNHPDINSFIIWAHDAYLTGNSGYAGVPRSISANTLLVDGKGQGHTGGHDAWKGFPYTLLNKVRIVKAVLTSSGFDIEGEAAGAYDPSLGLTEYQRELKMTSPGQIVVEDHIASTRPDTYSEVLHADRGIIERRPDDFTLEGYGGALQADLKQPRNVSESIEKNMVVGPGKPGSVQKGTLEQRGMRVVVSTKHPVTSAEFLWKLSF